MLRFPKLSFKSVFLANHGRIDSLKRSNESIRMSEQAESGFVPASRLKVVSEKEENEIKDRKAKNKADFEAPQGRKSLFDTPPSKRIKTTERDEIENEKSNVISIDDDDEDDTKNTANPSEVLKQWDWKKSAQRKGPQASPRVESNSSVSPVKSSSFSSTSAPSQSSLLTGQPRSTTKQAALVLADRLRPNSLDEYVGHDELVKPGSLLRTLIDNDTIPSCIFWGPPGSGKTSLANVIAHQTKCHFVKLSAVSSGVAQVKETIADAIERKKYRQHTVLFIDEIHRFNKLQQDALLPHVETGTVTLIGATTENPSFECNAALLSRCRVFVLNKLTSEQLQPLLQRAIKELAVVYPHRVSLGMQACEIDASALELLAGLADGDARQCLNALEMAFLATAPNKITTEAVKKAFQRTHILYDKTGEEHCTFSSPQSLDSLMRLIKIDSWCLDSIISALHKSMRGSDVQASLYWMARMLEGGEDPKYVARRLIRFASEDVGLADPQALVQAVSAFQAVQFIGMPECSVILAQTTAYLALAPKSNKLYEAYNAIQQAIKTQPLYPVPLHLRNAPTKMMEDLGFSKGYKYNPDHNYEGEIQDYLPTELKGSVWFVDDTAERANK